MISTTRSSATKIRHSREFPSLLEIYDYCCILLRRAYHEFVNANTLAAAVDLMTGKPCTVLCVHCLNDVDPHESIVAKRVGGHGTGFCVRCPYADGPELFVVAMSTVDACAIDLKEAA